MIEKYSEFISDNIKTFPGLLIKLYMERNRKILTLYILNLKLVWLKIVIKI